MDTTGLLLIDLQLDYFPGGAYPLVEPEAAVRVASAVLAAHRTAGLPIVHVQHLWDAPDAEYLKPGTPGVEIHPSVAPAPGEPLVTKAFPNSFRDTNLRETLAGLGVTSLTILGMMTSMCVDATVRAAADLGYSVTVIGDACAAPDLEHGGVAVPGPQVHAAFLAALGDGYASVVNGADVIAALEALEPAAED
jgi:nicotinamidase-related amidase